MIPKFLFIILLLLPTLSFAGRDMEYDTVTVKYDNGSPKEQYMRTNHHGNEKGFCKHGQYTSWYQNGNIEISAEYAYPNLLTGSYIRWYEDGMKAEETQYINGKKNGLSIEWYPDHVIKSKLYYKNGNLNGLCEWYSETPYSFEPNNLDSSCFFIDGEYICCIGRNNGRVENDFPVENKKLGIWLFRTGGYCIGKLKNGARQGKWTTYNERGEIIKQDLYKDGELLYVED